MPLLYPGIEVPRSGLVISIESPQRGGRCLDQEGHGWLRLIVRPGRVPLLSCSVSSNSEARPDSIANFSLALQYPLDLASDPRLSRLDLRLPQVADRPPWLRFWIRLLRDDHDGLADLQFVVLERDEDQARIALNAILADNDGTSLRIEGWIRAVAPDSVETRLARAPQNDGWLALSNVWGVNGDWDLGDGDLDDLPASTSAYGVDLAGNARLSDAGIHPLSRLSALEIAHLEGTGITGIGLKAFQRNPHFRAINASRTHLTDIGLTCLPGQQLTGLAVNKTKVTDEGLMALGQTPWMRSLLLGDTTIGDAGFLSLGPMPALVVLGLGGTRVTDRTISSLPEICPSLENLDITGAAVTEASVPALAALTKLTWVIGGEKTLGPSGTERLRQLRPDLSL